MTYYLTVDVGTFKHHVFTFEDRTRADAAFRLLRAYITTASSPYPSVVSIELDDDSTATFRVTDLRAVSLVKGRP